MNKYRIVVTLILFFFMGQSALASEQYQITRVDSIYSLDKSLVVIEVKGKPELNDSYFKKEKIIVVDFPDTILAWTQMRTKKLSVPKGVIKEIRLGQYKTKPYVTRVAIALFQDAPYKISYSAKNVEQVKIEQVVIEVTEPPNFTRPKVSKKEYQPYKPRAKLVTLNFKDADIGNVLQVLGEQADLNIVTDTSITGAITVSLKDVLAEDALNLILVANNLSLRKIGKTIFVARPEIIEEMEKKSFVTRAFRLEHLDASELKKTIEKIASHEENVQLHKNENMLIVTDTHRKLTQIERTISKMDQPPPAPKQVMLESLVIEIAADALRDFGFQLSEKIRATATAVPELIDESSIKSFTLKGLHIKSFALDGPVIEETLHILEERGDAKILANPKIATLSGKEATILIGDRVPYTETIYDATGRRTEEVKFVESGIRLNILPEIDNEGYVITKIKPEVSYIYGWKGPGNEIPWVKTREAEATVRVKDGESIVLGGLLSEEDRESLSKTPGLGHIPGLHLLFTRKKKERVKTDLIFIITPHILTEEKVSKIREKEEARIEEAGKKAKKKKWYKID